MKGQKNCKTVYATWDLEKVLSLGKDEGRAYAMKGGGFETHVGDGGAA